MRESTGTKNEVVARRMLRALEGDVERGIPIDPKVGRVTFDEAAEDMLNDYKANRKRTYIDAKRRIDKHLAPFFGNKRLSSLTASDIRAYIAKRLADTYLAHPARKVKRRNGTWQELPEVRRPVSVGEINRELTVLKRMFSLAIEAGKLHHKPHFAMLREDNVRVGFFEHEQYEAVLAHLPEGMRPVVTFAYVTGWRINSEVLPIQWRQVDLRVGEVRLDPGTTKNREGRVFYLTPELLPTPEGAAGRRRRDSAAEEHDRPARVLPSPPHQGGRPGHWPATVSPSAASTRLGGGLGGRRMPRQHPARFPADGHPEHGPGGNSGARGHEVERPQDSQCLRSL